MYVGIRLRQSQLWFLNFYIPRLTLNKSQYKRIADAKEKLSCTSRFFSFYQQIRLKFEEETSEMLRLEHGSLWC